MKMLYPAIKPFAQHTVKMTDGHELYVEEVGSPHGLPVLFIHGGPGAGCSEDDRRFFDPEKYHIILFDQRGCGRSTPFANLENNTTQDLIHDIERIRQFLMIDKWIVFGGSWGSTLGLLYAQAHPQYVMAMIMRGIFLCDKRDLQWFYQEGANFIFPDYWEEFIKPIPEAERGDYIQAYYQRLTGNDEVLRMHCAKQWSEWEAKCATLNPCKDILERFSHPHTAMSLARIEAHFFKHHAFIKANQIINEMPKIKDIPGIIIHGRYDVICPVENAFRLHQAWPESELHVIRDAGHSAKEPCITDALIDATNRFAVEFG